MPGHDVTILESTHMVSILLYIHGHPGCRKTDIYRDVGRPLGMAGKIGALVDAGLVDITEYDNNRAFFRLTPVGTEVVGYLCEMDGIVKDACLNASADVFEDTDL